MRLRAIAREVDAGVGEGVYAALHGPNYETPAEIRMLRLLGADLVGMSTALECIAARHLGAEVMGLSLVTNLAAGLGAATLDHAEVVEAGAAAGDRVGRCAASSIAVGFAVIHRARRPRRRSMRGLSPHRGRNTNRSTTGAQPTSSTVAQTAKRDEAGGGGGPMTRRPHALAPRQERVTARTTLP